MALACLGLWAGGTAWAGPDLPLSKLAARYGLKKGRMEVDAVEVVGPGLVMLLKADSRELMVNGVRVWMHAPAIRHRRFWLVSQSDAETVLHPLLSLGTRPAAARPLKVMLDPGHGGLDSGAVSLSGVHEKTLVFDLAERVRSRLLRAGATVQMTRESDTALGLRERTVLARTWGADILVSIHLNAATNPEANGVETFVLTAPNVLSTSNLGTPSSRMYPGHTHAAENMELAFHVHRHLLQRTGAPDRGIRHARFEVVRQAPCPAILVEGGFLSHAEEEKKLLSPGYRQDIAVALADGILDYAGWPSPESDPEESEDDAVADEPDA